MRGTSRTSLEDIAKIIGVSTATISRCINSPHKVAEPTRKRIQKAVEDLGYMPHFGGRALARNRTNTIGAIIPTMDNAMFAGGLQAFQDVLSSSGVTLLVGSSNYDPNQEFEQIRALLSQGADGLMLIGEERPTKTRKFLDQHSIPHVLAWCYSDASASAVVGFDNRKSGRAIAEHVINQGHTKLAVIAGIRHGNDRAENRIKGIEDAIEANPSSILLGIAEAKYSFESAATALEYLLNSPTRPTAIICGSDVLAVGALLRAHSIGIKVPDELSITGFDDITLAQVTSPRLTTVRIPQKEMGRQAANVLLNILAEGQKPGQLNRIELETTIIERGTLARL